MDGALISGFMACIEEGINVSVSFPARCARLTRGGRRPGGARLAVGEKEKKIGRGWDGLQMGSLRSRTCGERLGGKWALAQDGWEARAFLFFVLSFFSFSLFLKTTIGFKIQNQNSFK